MCVAAVRLVQLITRQQAVIRNIQANTITGHSHATLCGNPGKLQIVNYT